MLTLFTAAKPFRGHTAITQRSALRSWMTLHRDVQIILFGDAEVSQEVSWELCIHYEPHPELTACGSVRLDYMFAKAQQIARYTALCYAVCDTILLPDFCDAFNRVEALYPEFVMTGRGRDVRLTGPLAFDDPEWQTRLQLLAQTEVHHRSPDRVPYLVFSKGQYLNEVPAIPAEAPLSMNWLLWKAIAEEVTVVDSSEMVLAIQQRSEVSGSFRETDDGWQSRSEPLVLDGGRKHSCSIANAPYRLTSADVVRNRGHRLRQWQERMQHGSAQAMQAWWELIWQLRKTSGLPGTQGVRGNTASW